MIAYAKVEWLLIVVITASTAISPITAHSDSRGTARRLLSTTTQANVAVPVSEIVSQPSWCATMSSAPLFGGRVSVPSCLQFYTGGLSPTILAPKDTKELKYGSIDFKSVSLATFYDRNG